MEDRFTHRGRKASACVWAGWAVIGFFLVWTSAYSLEGVTDDVRPRKKSDEKIYLVHADNLRHNQFAHPDAQLLSGNVEFLHGGLRMYCDSAVLFELTNSFEAFGHVKMLQGDTLSLVGEYLFYDGESQIAQIRHNVVMKHRESVLTTDSLNYDRIYDVGYFFDGGKLVDGKNVLTSDWGEYYLSTKKSTFNYNVKLENPDYTLTSDTLHYDMVTKWADVRGPSNIVSGDSHIYTENGLYNTDTQIARLFDRPQLFNKGRSMTGDSLYYDKENGIARFYRNVFYEDKTNKNILTGHYGWYNELTGEALATDSALAKDYSNGDTLFVHADTLHLYSYSLKTDSAYRVMHGYFHVRAFREDVQAVCDSLVYNSRLNVMTLYRDPIVWSGERQILGEEINVYTNDSTIDSVYVERQALLVERVDSVHYNQVTGTIMKSYFLDGEMRENHVDGNVCVVNYPLERDSTVLYSNYLETTKLRVWLKEKKLERMWAPASKGAYYPLGMAPREKTFLANFAWFDYIRPTDKNDLFKWRGKKSGTELKPSVRKEVPLQTLDKH